jgi:RimJ/RimL family protein N-acetyltransferase
MILMLFRLLKLTGTKQAIGFKIMESPKIKIVSPFPLPDLYLVWEWAQAVWNAVSYDFTPRNVDEFIEFLSAWSQLPHVATWAVYANDEIAGYVRVERDPLRNWLCEAHCIFKKSLWGRRFGVTDASLVQIAEQIFDNGIERIGMTIFDSNGGMKALAKRIGAVEEGCLSMQTRKNEKYVNTVVYALTRERLQQAKENDYANGSTNSSSIDRDRGEHRSEFAGTTGRQFDTDLDGELHARTTAGHADAGEDVQQTIEPGETPKE